ncbi:MAG: hypothetical protein JST66_10540 [Bacteroidetes bacterium]|nr:hypothetical protein [Bacteroidota bacterium]
MERRERYDPEDLEHLLLERGYDELLEEERAFVLRHLSGRAEYESMRLLLHTVRQEERAHPPLEADPAVREHLLATFRAQHRPRPWGIWLNSVKAALWPEQASAFWRPALAVASLAVVVTVSVIGLRSWSDAPENAVAVVHEEKNVRPAAPLNEVTAPVTAPPAPASGAAQQSFKDTDAAVGTFSPSIAAGEVADAAELPSTAAVPAMDERATLQADLDLAKVPAASAAPIQADSSTLFGAQPGHVVTESELATNMSTANATGAVSKAWTSKGKKREEKERRGRADDGADAPAATDATAYVGLLRATW